MWKLQFHFLQWIIQTIIYDENDNEHCMKRENTKPNSFVWLFVEAQHRLILFEASIFMGAKEFANEHIKMPFRMRQHRWTKLELYWQFMPNVWGWSAYILVHHMMAVAVVVTILFYYYANIDFLGYNFRPSNLNEWQFDTFIWKILIHIRMANKTHSQKTYNISDKLWQLKCVCVAARGRLLMNSIQICIKIKSKIWKLPMYI